MINFLNTTIKNNYIYVKYLQSTNNDGHSLA